LYAPNLWKKLVIPTYGWPVFCAFFEIVKSERSRSNWHHSAKAAPKRKPFIEQIVIGKTGDSRDRDCDLRVSLFPNLRSTPDDELRQLNLACMILPVGEKALENLESSEARSR
jgi:hypothetical protein